MNVPNIIFSGPAGAGKTTAARLLVEKFPDLGYEQIAFATPLKIMLNTGTDRQRMQEFGTDVVRRYEPQAWVRLFDWHRELREQYRRVSQPYQAFEAPIRWVNDDLRFPNELETLRDQGWVYVKVDAPQYLRIDRLKQTGKYVDGMCEHESENALAGIEPDYLIQNLGSEDGLALEIATALNYFQRR